MGTSPPPRTLPLLVFFLSLLVFTITSHAKSKSVQTFSYTNIGDFGPYITENGADYRPLPLATSPFQFCFYNTTPDAFFLSLRMGLVRSESTFRWVWTPNINQPVSENATFELLPDGNLILADSNGLIVWSTHTAMKGVVGLKLLPTGNVVLHDKKNRFIWQSFDHPTDTLLVGQSLRVGGQTKLVSRNDRYSLLMEPGGLAMYINDITTKPLPYYSYTHDDNLMFSGNTSIVTFQCDPESFRTDTPYAYTLGLALAPQGGTIVLTRPKYNATLSFLRLEEDGNLVVYTYYDPVDYQAWEKTFAFFSNAIGRVSGCALPSKCGSLGVCEAEMCVACPSRKGLLGWSQICETPMVKCKTTTMIGKSWDNYSKVVGVENFLSVYGEGEVVVKVQECKKRCSLDCRCKGFMFRELESKCWLAPLIGTLNKVDNSSHVAYIKFL